MFGLAAVNFEGEQYNIPADIQEWPVSVFRNVKDGLYDEAVKLLLGADQFRRFEMAHPQIVRTYVRFFEAVGAQV